ncbi:54S ribosomal protein L15, mitochondrial [[Candida] jaroonii]|uniref:54S ribosomal protein L15, mitochondrial n=1 Tax=[Candida] jaroonii TaxID=467808 RepID=A0ACA9YC22_9ASCO|nr:54S ribosomal protein L15, mitochondrial [[Candida] jaroonii]
MMKQFIPRNLLKSFQRNIYLHRGSRISGLKKHPEEVFTNYKGIKYEDIDSNTQYINEFLTDKFKIDNKLALQVITHKSFANGIKPHNEKLVAMGSRVLNLFLVKHVTSQQTTNELAINNQNLDILGQPFSRELSGRLSLGIFAKVEKLNTIMFWNTYEHGLSFENSGELKVSANLVYALIGAINFTHGKTVAEEFIKEKVLPQVEDITKKIFDSEGKVE